MAKPAETFFGLEYSGPKGGKTVNAVFAFPNATFIGDPKAIQPQEELTGWRIKDIRQANSIKEATELLEKIAQEKKPKPGHPVIVCVDDLTVLADDTVAFLAPKFTNKMQLYGEIKTQIINFRIKAANLGLCVWANTHLEQPFTDKEEGHFFIGGPRFPGKNNGYAIAAKVETIVRTEVHPQRRQATWGRVYRCNPNDEKYVTGDRWGAVYDNAPHNIGELFRARGFNLPRAVGMEWQEEIVEYIASSLFAVPVKDLGKVTKEIKAEVVAHLVEQDISETHIYWTWRDGEDRATIRRHNQNKFKAMLGL